MSISPSAQRMLDDDVASRSLGIEIVHAVDGTARAELSIGPHMVNGHDIAHGGYLFLLADTAFAFACNSHGPVTVAAGADITFVAPARLGDRLVAIATERTRYGRNGIYDVTVLRDGAETNTVVAEFRGRSRRIDAG